MPIPLEAFAALVVFLCLALSALGTLMLYDKVPARFHHDDTVGVVRLIAGLFIVMTSLVIGLMINSSRSTFETADHTVHVFVTEVILFDRALQRYGPDAAGTRKALKEYAIRASTSPISMSGTLARSDPHSENLLSNVGGALGAIRPGDTEHADMLRDLRQQFQSIVKLRWSIVEQSDGNIPVPMVVMVATWLVLIFGSFGYRAPRNVTVVSSLLVAAFLMSGTVYLVLDMDIPFNGIIHVSDMPLRRMVAELP